MGLGQSRPTLISRSRVSPQIYPLDPLLVVNFVNSVPISSRALRALRCTIHRVTGPRFLFLNLTARTPNCGSPAVRIILTCVVSIKLPGFVLLPCTLTAQQLDGCNLLTVEPLLLVGIFSAKWCMIGLVGTNMNF
jgi:hypothetical protein